MSEIPSHRAAEAPPRPASSVVLAEPETPTPALPAEERAPPPAKPTLRNPKSAKE